MRHKRKERVASDTLPFPLPTPRRMFQSAPLSTRTIEVGDLTIVGRLIKKRYPIGSGLRRGFCCGLRQCNSTLRCLPAFVERYGNPRRSAVNGHQDFGFARRQIHRFHRDCEIVGNLRERDALSRRMEFQSH